MLFALAATQVGDAAAVKVVSQDCFQVFKGCGIEEMPLLKSGSPTGLEALLLHLHLLTPQFVHAKEEWILHRVHTNELQIRLSKPESGPSKKSQRKQKEEAK